MRRTYVHAFRPGLLALLACALLACALLLGGCFAKKPPGPAQLQMSALGSADLNPDVSGRASPLVVRIYSLRSLAEFEKADFFALYEKDEQLLAADLVKREELILKPGDKLSLPREFPTDVHYVAVLGAFRDIAKATWRASAEVKAGTKGKLTIEAGAKSISVSVAADE